MDPGGFAGRQGFTLDDVDVERGTELCGGSHFSINLTESANDALLSEAEESCRFVRFIWAS